MVIINGRNKFHESIIIALTIYLCIEVQKQVKSFGKIRYSSPPNTRTGCIMFSFNSPKKLLSNRVRQNDIPSKLKKNKQAWKATTGTKTNDMATFLIIRWKDTIWKTTIDGFQARTRGWNIELPTDLKLIRHNCFLLEVECWP